MRNKSSLLKDMAIGAVAGVVGTYALTKASSVLYKLESEEKKRREESLRPQGEYPTETMARKILEKTAGEPSDETKEKLANAIHWGYGIGWGVLYGALRTRVPFLRRALGAPFGAAFWAVGDELMNPVLGLTPPPQAWPWENHARALASHLAFAAAAEGTCQALHRLLR